MSYGWGCKTQDVIKMDITDIELQFKPNEIVILSFLSKFSPLFCAWVTQKIQVNAEGLKLISW